MAAAAWSCVEKMLHDAQRTSAPSAFSVSMSTAVWIVMWSDPATRAPFRGCAFAYSSRIAMSAGISPSAIAISFLPHSASDRSATRKSSDVLLCGAALIAPSFPQMEKGSRAPLHEHPSLAAATAAAVATLLGDRGTVPKVAGTTLQSPPMTAGATWIDEFPGNFVWSNATLVTKGMAPYGAVALAEIDEVCMRLRPRQGESHAWTEEWSAMGRRLEAVATTAAAEGREMSAGNAFLRAGMYYFTAER